MRAALVFVVVLSACVDAGDDGVGNPDLGANHSVTIRDAGTGGPDGFALWITGSGFAPTESLTVTVRDSSWTALGSYGAGELSVDTASTPQTITLGLATAAEREALLDDGLIVTVANGRWTSRSIEGVGRYRYLSLFLFNWASIDHREPNNSELHDEILAYEFGFDASERAAARSAMQALRTLDQQIRSAFLRNDQAALSTLLARRFGQLITQSKNLYAALRPAVAARLDHANDTVAPYTLEALATLGDADATPIDTLAKLQDCIGPQGAQLGYGTTCRLAASATPYPIPFTDSQGVVRTSLLIGRSNIEITGTPLTGATDTVIRRATQDAGQLLKIAGQLTNVRVRFLTFDGNRYGVGGLQCLPGNAPLFDVNLSPHEGDTIGGRFLVQLDDFINAPGTALLVGGDLTVVTMNNIGLGSPTETAARSATRSSAIRFNGDRSKALYNIVAYAGTAGLGLLGSNQYAIGNLLFNTRYELPDGSTGGHLFTSPDSTNSYVIANIIDGNNWAMQPTSVLATGCAPLANPQHPSGGAEPYGWGHKFYANEIIHNNTGIVFTDALPTGAITIQGDNPFFPGDLPRFIEDNALGGIAVLGPDNNQPYHLTGITLRNLRVKNNAGFGVTLTGAINRGEDNGYKGTHCILGNELGPTFLLHSPLSYPDAVLTTACPPSPLR